MGLKPTESAWVSSVKRHPAKGTVDHLFTPASQDPQVDGFVLFSFLLQSSRDKFAIDNTDGTVWCFIFFNWGLTLIGKMMITISLVLLFFVSSCMEAVFVLRHISLSTFS